LHLVGVSGRAASTGIGGSPPYCWLSLAAAGPGLFRRRRSSRAVVGLGGRWWSCGGRPGLGEAIGKQASSLPGQATAVQIHPVPSGPAGRALLWLAGVPSGDPPISLCAALKVLCSIR
jgi:hypothetical protein